MDIIYKICSQSSCLSIFIVAVIGQLHSGCSGDNEVDKCWQVEKIDDGSCVSLNRIHGCCNDVVYAVGEGYIGSGVIFSNHVLRCLPHVTA